ncbi:hypothetical protein MAR_000864 [Mya arenaria]|uniref:Uncharacterized protein n=1 Tax=Mya arenaria TaxID=6604 RepID=A0ABY7FE28_MYAAR|nr:hypothetical protein MAR_000864 [Mya arenaria]
MAARAMWRDHRVPFRLAEGAHIVLLAEPDRDDVARGTGELPKPGGVPSVHWGRAREGPGRHPTGGALHIVPVPRRLVGR